LFVSNEEIRMPNTAYVPVEIIWIVGGTARVIVKEAGSWTQGQRERNAHIFVPSGIVTKREGGLIGAGDDRRYLIQVGITDNSPATVENDLDFNVKPNGIEVIIETLTPKGLSRWESGGGIKIKVPEGDVLQTKGALI